MKQPTQFIPISIIRRLKEIDKELIKIYDLLSEITSDIHRYHELRKLNIDEKPLIPFHFGCYSSNLVRRSYNQIETLMVEIERLEAEIAELQCWDVSPADNVYRDSYEGIVQMKQSFDKLHDE